MKLTTSAFVALCGIAMLAASISSAADLSPRPVYANEVVPGVFEWTDADGAFHRQAEGRDGLDWVIATIEGRVQTLAAEVGPSDLEHPDLLGGNLQLLSRLMAYRESIDQAAALGRQCVCLQPNQVSAEIVDYLGFPWVQADVVAYTCAGHTYEAMAVAIAVSSTGQKKVDCSFDAGASLDIQAAASWGYSGHRCLRAEGFLWIDAPPGCADGFIYRVSPAFGEHPEECESWSPCG